MTMKTKMIALLTAALMLMLVACGGAEPAPAPEPAATATEEVMEVMVEEEMAAPLPSIAAIAASNEDFSTLVAALDAAGLVETLDGEGSFTVFAPTNDAFDALPEGTVAALLQDPSGDLTQILLYHVVDGAVMAADVVNLDAATTLEGEDIAIAVEDGVVMLNGSAAVVTTDIEASNGVIHVIDAVILPPSMTAAVEEEMGPTIAEVAADAGTFGTLLTALTEAGLADSFADPDFGPVTVFAPTDEAFAALPDGLLATLLADPTGALANVLRYHVVPGTFSAADVVMIDTVSTDLGQGITIEVDADGNVILNGTVKVIATDIVASNGIIHVIDGVLVPSEG